MVELRIYPNHVCAKAAFLLASRQPQTKAMLAKLVVRRGEDETLFVGEGDLVRCRGRKFDRVVLCGQLTRPTQEFALTRAPEVQHG